MQKIKAAANNFDMDFLDGLDKTVGKKNEQTIEPAEIVIDPTVDLNTEIAEDISITEDSTSSRSVKNAQILIRTTEKERDALKAYFMKHGVSVTKGLKIAVKYLEQQEKKGLVHFSEIGLY